MRIAVLLGSAHVWVGRVAAREATEPLLPRGQQRSGELVHACPRRVGRCGAEGDQGNDQRRHLVRFERDGVQLRPHIQEIAASGSSLDADGDAALAHPGDIALDGPCGHIQSMSQGECRLRYAALPSQLLDESVLPLDPTEGQMRIGRSGERHNTTLMPTSACRSLTVV